MNDIPMLLNTSNAANGNDVRQRPRSRPASSGGFEEQSHGGIRSTVHSPHAPLSTIYGGEVAIE